MKSPEQKIDMEHREDRGLPPLAGQRGRESYDWMAAGRVDVIVPLRSDYVTCLTCDRCYDGHGRPSFCQEFLKVVDEREVLKNQETARRCLYWFPAAIGRANANFRSGGDV